MLLRSHLNNIRPEFLLCNITAYVVINSLMMCLLLYQVQREDQIVLESIKTPGQYIHVSGITLPASSAYANWYVYDNCSACVSVVLLQFLVNTVWVDCVCSHEVNLSVRQSGFSIVHRCSPQKEENHFLMVWSNGLLTIACWLQRDSKLVGYLCTVLKNMCTLRTDLMFVKCVLCNCVGGVCGAIFSSWVGGKLSGWGSLS